MTSKVTTVYSTILSTLGTLFPNKTRIPNPYDLTQNADGFLRDGYGVKFNGSSFVESEFCVYRYSANISVVFTNEILRTEEDTTTMESVTNSLLENMHEVRKDFYNVDQLGIEASIDSVDIDSSTGIEFIEGDKFNYASLEVNFIFNISETL